MKNNEAILRAALLTGLCAAEQVATELHASLKGYLQHKHDAVDADVAEIKAAIALLDSIEQAPDAEQGAGMAGQVQWEPAFDVMSWDQEKLSIKFCEEIAGKRGEKSHPPDPVRLLEMAQALYEAERKDFFAAPLPPTAIKEPIDPLQAHSDLCQKLGIYDIDENPLIKREKE